SAAGGRRVLRRNEFDDRGAAHGDRASRRRVRTFGGGPTGVPSGFGERAGGARTNQRGAGHPARRPWRTGAGGKRSASSGLRALAPVADSTVFRGRTLRLSPVAPAAVAIGFWRSAEEHPAELAAQ